jgi:hypothetical protein
MSGDSSIEMYIATRRYKMGPCLKTTGMVPGTLSTMYVIYVRIARRYLSGRAYILKPLYRIGGARKRGGG